MNAPLTVRPIAPADRAAWEPLWAGYNAFYERSGPTALAPEITQALWDRLFDPAEPVHALVAEQAGEVVGLVHFLFHRSTSRIEPVCYLQDLFTAPEVRGRGVGRALIEGVYARARDAGASRVYWQTRESNAAGRALYDKVAEHRGFIVYSHDV
ncbi:GNAT family N-acetyltransferase [Scleromatobacter humisilvae]|uniref:GNAT family N-acetyltransferase n=1 Tax=Scleromatobacter humisilvae TaxID=2897159 RepID=A0A9X1YPS7_9BURK|nr:GNAT family N-acetyltransferase [Scleromatobacter humisilvae]MCK9685566.1 GNAT family N-acetyltransferase [Scleromatobacter humisilvae]